MGDITKADIEKQRISYSEWIAGASQALYFINRFFYSIKAIQEDLNNIQECMNELKNFELKKHLPSDVTKDLSPFTTRQLQLLEQNIETEIEYGEDNAEHGTQEEWQKIEEIRRLFAYSKARRPKADEQITD